MFNLKLKKRSLIILASILGLLIIFQSLAFAQPTSAPPGGNIDASFNKVGIGNSTPTELLSVGTDLGISTSKPNNITLGDATNDPNFFIGKDVDEWGDLWWDNSEKDLVFTTWGGLPFGANNHHLVLDSQTGTVGIGTSAPFAKFQVGKSTTYPDTPFLTSHPSSIAIADDTTNSQPGLWIGNDIGNNAKMIFNSATSNLEFMTTTGPWDADIHDQQLILAGNGNVGINAGSSITNQSLLVKKGDDSINEIIRGEYDANNYGYLGSNGGGAGAVGRNYGLYAAATPAYNSGNTVYGIESVVDTNGTGTFYSGYFHKTSTPITGGTYLGLDADLRSGDSIDIAEYILDTNDNLEAADVVIADPNNSESVIKSTIPYDTNTLGVISTKPHLTMGMDVIRNPETGEMYENVNAAKLTLAGRIPIKVTNENGQIKPGDLLTTSSTPGYAMKWTLLNPENINDINELKNILIENERRQNAIIGKALESLETEEGTIVGLLSL